ncbi:DUF3047 domain-containing protein [Anaeromyxobacter paludicola]|uniref:DUF3047 domain-containing protein n=1 Tax=Anaeromyxobacter paludicola TaxID=2918171 RepID=A0ABM7X976_9BACT|nr:DUF3047 domain-containing protein [Anaeromyxobacter paludicola]BDG08360.1 hypothetical protein AMPC_14730 [Anaeromyxobacter paludicola]
MKPLLARAAAAAATLVLLAAADPAPTPTATPAVPPPPPFLNEEKLPLTDFRVVERDSGPVMYYQVTGPPDDRHIHAEYKPPLETVTLGLQLPDRLHQKATKLRWRWRALAVPEKGNECDAGRGDSAACVYVVWKSGLKYYVIKYVWAGTGRRGRSCQQKRNLFAAQDAVVRESGRPLGEWITEEVDLKAAFRSHFLGGDPKGDVPDLVGIGLLTDGDQTHSPSVADYAGFSILY